MLWSAFHHVSSTVCEDVLPIVDRETYRDSVERSGMQLSGQSPHDRGGHHRRMKCGRQPSGCGRRNQFAAASAHRVWCGTVGTIDCRYEHKPEIPLQLVVLSRWPPTKASGRSTRSLGLELAGGPPLEREDPRVGSQSGATPLTARQDWELTSGLVLAGHAMSRPADELPLDALAPSSPSTELARGRTPAAISFTSPALIRKALPPGFLPRPR